MISFGHMNTYRFFDWKDLLGEDSLEYWRSQLLDLCLDYKLRGTILLSSEGININVSGCSDDLIRFQTYLNQQACFADLLWNLTHAFDYTYQKMQVKIKSETITFRQNNLSLDARKAEYLSPQALKAHLDQGLDLVIIDVRNEYETQYGLFKGSVDLNLKQFTDFPDAMQRFGYQFKTRPVLITCTGGIRCEKAGAWMIQQGYEEVYQIQGGIIQYFTHCGGAYYQDNCFVFDDRVVLDPHLKPMITG